MKKVLVVLMAFAVSSISVAADFNISKKNCEGFQDSPGYSHDGKGNQFFSFYCKPDKKLRESGAFPGENEDYKFSIDKENNVLIEVKKLPFTPAQRTALYQAFNFGSGLTFSSSPKAASCEIISDYTIKYNGHTFTRVGGSSSGNSKNSGAR